jgi:uncharacterized repeat protein (TIGR01451 family)
MNSSGERVVLRVGGYPSKIIARPIANTAEGPHRLCHWLLLAFIVISFAGRPAQANPNLLIDGGFELGTGWTTLSWPSRVERSTNEAAFGVPPNPEGSWFCEVEAFSLSPTSVPDYLSQTVATAAGERYFLSVQATTRTDVNTADRMILYADGTNLASVTTTNAWVTYRASFAALSASSEVRLVSNGSATGTYPAPGDSAGLIVDDVQVQELTSSPGAQTTAEDSAKAFSAANGNALQIATNTGSFFPSVTLSVTNGTLTLASTAGLTFTAGGNGTALMTFNGTVAAINAALNAGLTYMPTADFNGSSTLTFVATAGASDTDTIAVSVTPVADIVADSVSTIENSAISFNAITGTNGASADNFEGSPAITAVGSASHGTVTFTAAGVITYTPTAGYSGTDTFTYTVTSGGVTETATETITIKALPRVTLTKISNGGVGGFTFTGTNGWASQTITTVTSGIGVAGATQTLSATSTATTITETIPATFVLSSVTCTGLGAGGTATPNLVTGALALDAAATAAGSAISCTFTNTKLIPAMTVVKSANTAGPVSAGVVITYTFKVKNTGNTTITNVSLADTFNGNGTPPAPANEVLSLDAAPVGDSSNGTANDGIWAVLGPGDEVTFTAPYTVTQADIDLLQ